jgi:phytoene dehydrogenase-like protein
METAYDDAKYGRFSRKPYIDMIIPTLVDPSMAPPGKHVISCFVQYAPYKLAPSSGRGTTSARPSATPWSTGSPSSPRTSATSSCSATSRPRSTSSARPG